jgi:hypothetical protein
MGVHLVLATPQGRVQVHVAPSGFLSGKHWEFSRGDEVEVVGTPIVLEGHQALVTRTIMRGNQTVAVRTPEGKPPWVE